jgi:hypothetical protein
MSTENVVPFPRAVRGRPPIIAIAPSKTNGISFAMIIPPACVTASGVWQTRTG